MTATTRTLRHFRVLADAETGQWIGRAVETEPIDRAAFLAQLDTDTKHYDTFERDGETCAVTVVWVDDDGRE